MSLILEQIAPLTGPMPAFLKSPLARTNRIVKTLYGTTEGGGGVDPVGYARVQAGTVMSLDGDRIRPFALTTAAANLAPFLTFDVADTTNLYVGDRVYLDGVDTSEFIVDITGVTVTVSGPVPTAGEVLTTSSSGTPIGLLLLDYDTTVGVDPAGAPIFSDQGTMLVVDGVVYLAALTGPADFQLFMPNIIFI